MTWIVNLLHITSPLTNSIIEDPFQSLIKEFTSSCTENLVRGYFQTGYTSNEVIVSLDSSVSAPHIFATYKSIIFLFILSVRSFIKIFADYEAFASNAVQVMVWSLHEETACTRYSLSPAGTSEKYVRISVFYFFLEPALPSCPCPLLQHISVIIFTNSFWSYQRNQKCGHTNSMCRAWIQSITTKQTYWISKASFKCTLNLKDSTVIVNYFWSENIIEATIIWRKILGSDLLGSLKDPLWWAAVVAGSSPWIRTEQQPQFCFGIYKSIFRVVLQILQIITGSE